MYDSFKIGLKDNSKIDEPMIKEAGSYGIKRMRTEAMQIVIGLDVVHVAEKCNNCINQNK